MKTRILSNLSSVLCIAPCVAALSCVAQGGGRSFLASRSSIDVTEAPICASAVVDNEECRPGNFGGAPWQKHTSFPPYSVPDSAVRRGPSYIAAEVRTHYLGSPYYAGDVHVYCKTGIDTDAIPGDNTSLQEYELAKVIEDRAVKPLASRVHSALEARVEDDARALTRRFQERLMEEVHDRVKAKVLWFVTRYPGGLPDISRNRSLRKCMQEQRDNNGSALVTGVAGYVVLNNQIDTAISSESTVHRALDQALSGHEDASLDIEFKRSLGLEWQDRVNQVAQIKLPRNDVTAVAWPLWVQFE